MINIEKILKNESFYLQSLLEKNSMALVLIGKLKEQGDELSSLQEKIKAEEVEKDGEQD